MNHARALLPLTAAVAIAGCGITNPYQAKPSPRSPSAGAAWSRNAISTVNDPSDPGPGTLGPRGTIPPAAAAEQTKLAATAGQPTPEAALVRYGRLYTNWTSSTVGAVQRELASISLGQARAQALQAAASYTRDPVLEHSKVANTGTVVAITAGQGTAQGEWVIVSSETTTGQGDYTGLPPTVHVTYAQLAHTPQGWIVSAWHPQS